MMYYPYIIADQVQFKSMPDMDFLPRASTLWTEQHATQKLHDLWHMQHPLTLNLRKQVRSKLQIKHLFSSFFFQLKNRHFSYLSGPSCSKLMMPLVNILTLIIKYGIYTNIFAEKMWVAFAKATHIFSAKIPVNLVLYLLEQLSF